jgi:hypothetical protein
MQMDALCDNCQDLADARLADKAHELVDSGNIQYKNQWHLITEPSGHEWVSPTQIVGFDQYGEPIVRKENYEGEIQARLESLSFDDDPEIPANQVVCNWCHLTTLAQVKCVNCDEYVS